jgi:hypothetical protein
LSQSNDPPAVHALAGQPPAGTLNASHGDGGRQLTVVD